MKPLRLIDVRVQVLKHHTAACDQRLRLQDGWATGWWINGNVEWRSRSGQVRKKANKRLWLVAGCNLGCGAKAVIDAMDLGDVLANVGHLPRSGPKGKRHV